MRGVFLDLATLDRGDMDLNPLTSALDTLSCHPTSTREQTLHRVRQAEVIITNKVHISREVIAAAPQLRLVCLAATGYNNVDIEAANAAGVRVCNIRDYCTDAVAQHVFALILSLNQRLEQYGQALDNNAWRHSPQFCLLDWPFRELSGQTLGIVGYGVLGQAVGRLAQAFGMRIRIAQRPGGQDTRPDRTPLADLLEEVDILSLHCPLTPETEQLIDAAALARMKPEALLINTARGGIVDSKALVQALEAGKLGGAGIDVLRQEPPIDGDPLLDFQSPRLIVTPHIAWASVEARQRALDAITENILAFRAGRPIHCVNTA